MTLWEYVRVGINPRKWFKDQTKAKPPRSGEGGRRGKVTAQIPQGGEGRTRGVGSVEARKEGCQERGARGVRLVRSPPVDCHLGGTEGSILLGG